MKVFKPVLFLFFLLGHVVGQNDPGEATDVPAEAPAGPGADTPFPTSAEILEEEKQMNQDNEPAIEVENNPNTPANNETNPAQQPESPGKPETPGSPPDANESPAEETTSPSSGEPGDDTTLETNAPSEGSGPGGAGSGQQSSQSEVEETPVPTNPSESETDAPTDTTGEGGTDDFNEGPGGEDEGGTDDFNEGPDEGEYEGEGEWVDEAEEERTKAPYVPPTGDDPFAKPPDESEWSNSEQWPQETPEQMMHDKNVIIAVSSAVLFGIVLAIFSAQQVIENPDGCCSRLCCGNKDRRSHDLMIGESNSYTHDLELT
ncbi:expressed unknown protein [Seminavis robusta]|uniref:Uncharacterized protein n=1 Tax=Seminavis robusta TaxID=568900 RepID=A0A9N8DTS9_9STRA|nr:expressed unknown protein [Seminavis robusta]|eukprot:Sro245_g097300.1 n/a (317) ;mRNA; f:18013-19128